MASMFRPLRVLLGLILRRPILSASVIPVMPDGTIVLIRRKDNSQWGLPGGIVDWGEDISTAARRELLEETGLSQVRLGRLVGIYSAPERDPRFHSICVAIEARVQGTPSIIDPHEVLEIQSFSPANLPLGQLAHDHDRQLKDYFSGSTVLS